MFINFTCTTLTVSTNLCLFTQLLYPLWGGHSFSSSAQRILSCVGRKLPFGPAGRAIFPRIGQGFCKWSCPDSYICGPGVLHSHSLTFRPRCGALLERGKPRIGKGWERESAGPHPAKVDGHCRYVGSPFPIFCPMSGDPRGSVHMCPQAL